ncbi:MAG TPA: hypothetical protein VFS56_09570 [Gemmatimonadaceae bacterium]|nr:hypothetical protein [Gemmatimonadaceae bacterium]
MKIVNAMGRILVAAAIILFGVGCNDRADQPTGITSVGASGAAANQSVGNDGSGSNFKVFGDADVTRDPENPANIVLEVRSDGVTPAGAYRTLNNVQLWELDHQVNFHRAFVAPHTCSGGSPRVILFIDANGDGQFQTAPNGPDFAANGHVRPPFAGCETSTPTANNGEMSTPSTLLWRFEDLTDEQPRWEITGGTVPGFPAFPGATWDQLETLISTAFANHEVIQAIFLEDFNPSPPGTSYYDLITIHDLTLGTRGQWQPERGRFNNAGPAND